MNTNTKDIYLLASVCKPKTYSRRVRKKKINAIFSVDCLSKNNIIIKMYPIILIILFFKLNKNNKQNRECNKCYNSILCN